MPIKHAFTSAAPEGTDASKVRTSNWNANHDLSGMVINDVPGLTTALAGKGPASQPVLWRTLTGSVAYAHGSFLKVDFPTLKTDSISGWDATNQRYTPNVAGWYNTNWAVTVTGTVTDGLAQLRVNGVSVGTSNASQGNASSVTYSGGKLVFLNGTTDYVEVWAYTGGIGSPTRGDPTYFDAVRLSA